MRLLSLAAASLALALASSGCLHSILGGDAGARDFLSAKTYTKWVVEVDSVQGMEPPAGVLDLLHTRLASVANKPDGIEIRTSAALPVHGGTWSDKDIRDFESAHRDMTTSGKTAALHVLFLDGHYRIDGVLGVTYTTSGGSSSGPIAIFSQAIKEGCGPLCIGGTSPAFKTVLVHEAGHALGIVNNGIPMASPHEDGAHPGHSSNPNDVMYYAAETNGLFNLANPPSDDYDAADRADMCKAGGRC